MPTRDVWRMHRAGSLGDLRREREDLAPPGPGEARVRVEAIGLNFADVFSCLGLYSATPRGPFIPGLECAGTVEAIGEGAPNSGVAGTEVPALHSHGLHSHGPAVAPGDRVMVLTRFGGFATAVNAGTRYLLGTPDGWSSDEAAAFLVQAITAWYGLVRLGELTPGETVLVHSGAGGVGLNALAIVDRVGGRAIATVGADNKVAFLSRERGLTADRVIVRDRHRFGTQIDKALSSIDATGLDLVFDAVAGPYFLPALTRLRPEGRHVLYGAADLMPAGTRPNWPKLAWQYLRRPRVDPLRLIDRNRAVLGFNLIWLFHEAHRLPDAFAAARALIEGPPIIGARFSFAELPAALEALQSGRTVGKVVVRVPTAPEAPPAG
jgi:NADPH:quinone reductase-like Zn-dependent oxidoreductase